MEALINPVKINNNSGTVFYPHGVFYFFIVSLDHSAAYFFEHFRFGAVLGPGCQDKVLPVPYLGKQRKNAEHQKDKQKSQFHFKPLY
jgi:hypothetical protein